MDSTPRETPTGQSSPPTLEELTRQTARMIVFPYIVAYVARMAPPPQSRNVIVIVNARTWSMTMIESGIDLETFIAEKMGPLPASKASIEAMPVVKVEEEGQECSICLAEFDVGGEAKEMPCKHRYHSDCIEKWLGMRGSCPLCRYSMPVEEINDRAAQTDAQHEEDEYEEGLTEDEPDDRGRTFVLHIYYAGRRIRRRGRYSESQMDPDWNSSQGEGTGDGNLDGNHPDLSSLSGR